MSEAQAAAGLVHPTSEQLLDGVVRLARDLHLDSDEARIVDLAIQTLAELFPGRGFAVRVFDPRSPDRARTYASWELRPEVATERVVLKESSLEKTRLKSAVAASARLRFGGRWDSPFPGVSHGFAVPLVGSWLGTGVSPLLHSAVLGVTAIGVVLSLWLTPRLGGLRYGLLAALVALAIGGIWR